MTRVAIALGSNLGDRLGNLRAAVAALEEVGVAVVRRSFAWETLPVPADQPPFLNAAVLGETSLPPAPLLAALKGIEHALGRRPGRRWGPRPIDLDILFYGDLHLETPDLTIPHPRIAERAFVLAPLSEILEGPLPVLGTSALHLLERTGLQGARRLCAL